MERCKDWLNIEMGEGEKGLGYIFDIHDKMKRNWQVGKESCSL